MRLKDYSMKSGSTRIRTIMSKRWLRAGALAVVAAGLALGLAASQSTPTVLPKAVDLNSSPNTVIQEVPNIALALSVEFPTVGAAYRNSTYDPGTTYLGYWDSTGCYTYKETSDTSSANLNGEYFVRSGTVSGTGSNATCGGSAYSGNLLNYVASSAIDILRLGLTGGHRAIDTSTRTVLERAYLYNGWALNDANYFPARQIPIALVGRVMPTDPSPLAGAAFVYAGSCKNKLWFGRQTANGANCDNPSASTTTNETSTTTTTQTNPNNYCPWTTGSSWYCTNATNNIGTCTGPTRVRLDGKNRDVYTCTSNRYTVTTTVTTPVTTTTYYGDLNPERNASNVPLPMYTRVKVCEGTETASRTDLCQRYPSGNYKPVGQIQLKSDGAKVAVFGYLAENGNGRNGGVLRAPMDFLGPTKLSNTGTVTNNANKEWDLSTGVFTTNPRNATGYTYSGAINYINRFGTTGTAGYYKSNDPVGELYYEALRYFMGLGPSGDAVSTPMSDDGYPVYSSWTDPISSSCQRKNYILTIGDVNTHFDKRLPGHRTSSVASVNESGTDTSRALESLTGGGSLDTPYWAGVIGNFETNTTSNFTNSLGATVVTDGNPNTNGNNATLNSKATGSSSSAYYWAGAAYWANTQAIRNDNDSAGKSKSKVRVRTFTIDVDEGGNGSIEDTNPRGIKPRRSSFYLAGKYGWFQNTDGAGQTLKPVTNPAGVSVALDGHPFRNMLTGAEDNSRWQDPAVPNTPDGYVIASQAQKLLDGIKKFFDIPIDTIGTPTVTALSSLRFSSTSPDGDTFLPQFNAKTWAGNLLKAKVSFDTASGQVQVVSTTWDAGKILTDASVAATVPADSPMVLPANRKIFTFSRDAGKVGGQAFTVNNKGNLDTAVMTALQTKPTTAPGALSASDMADAHINWLRGVRTNEVSSTSASGYLRLRYSVLGDIINSGTIYKKEADPQVTGVGYGAFATTHKTRTAVVYVGANDGMLHAFSADTGKELFAYIPRAVAPYLNTLADPYYVHRPFVDAVPVVGEAQVADSDGNANWKTLLVSGMGGGAQGVFALDVTNPDSFDASKVMFEFTDSDDPDMGNVVTPPRLVKVRMAGTGAPVYKWFVAVSSGYNNYQADGHASADGTQALFLLSVDKSASDAWTLGTNYFKMNVAAPAADNTKTAALANPGFAQGLQGDAIIFYAGDTQGNLWKFDLQLGLSADNAAAAIQKSGGQPIPMAILADSTGKRRPITTAPMVAPGLSYGFMVIAGTGKYIERTDSTDATVQAIYGVWDNLSTTATDYQIGTSKLFQRTLNTSTGLLDGAATFTYGVGSGTGADRTYRGWYFELPAAGERVSVDGDNRFGYSAINSMIPPPDCNVIGTSRSITADNIYGSSVGAAVEITSGFLGQPHIVLLDDSAGVYSYTARSAVGRRDLVIKSAPISSTSEARPRVVQGSTVAVKVPAGRVGWREIKDFED